MTSVSYNIDQNQVVGRDASSGTILWSVRFEGPVLQIVALEDDECLALVSAVATKPTYENLFKIGADGTIRWIVQLLSTHDPVADLIDLGDRVEARTWGGWRVEIDLNTGHLRNPRFVK